jgi:ubiquinone/menaquinone biosynthesis C-methylase UbiE
MHTWLARLFCLLVVLGSFGFSQRRDPLEYVLILESAERVKMLQVDRVIQALNIEPGQRIADLGAGSGLFSRPLADLVGPDGVVYAIDIDSDLLEHVNETALEKNLTNIQTVLASEQDPRIPDGVDLVLICDTLHQIEDPSVYLRGLTNYLRPSARIAVIDYENNWPRRFESAKYTVDELDKWMSEAGLQREEKFDFLDDNFFVTYRYLPEPDVSE